MWCHWFIYSNEEINTVGLSYTATMQQYIHDLSMTSLGVSEFYEHIQGSRVPNPRLVISLMLHQCVSCMKCDIYVYWMKVNRQGLDDILYLVNFISGDQVMHKIQSRSLETGRPVYLLLPWIKGICTSSLRHLNICLHTTVVLLANASLPRSLKHISICVGMYWNLAN